MASKRRPRGRPAGGSEKILRTIFDATLSQLAADGYPDLSVEEIARAAGVNKTSVYRRWPTRAALVLAALTSLTVDDPPFSPSADLRADLVGLLTSKARRLATARGRAIGRALMSIEDDEEMAASLRARRFRLQAVAIEAAKERGELPASVDPQLASELVLAPIVHRILVLGESAPASFIEHVVAHSLAGLGYERRPKKKSARSKKAT